ncbi:MAG: hypothetical protein RL095_4018 [Verrucomicrobiota bacterium]|jgi:outer membrane protein TolC
MISTFLSLTLAFAGEAESTISAEPAILVAEGEAPLNLSQLEDRAIQGNQDLRKRLLAWERSKERINIERAFFDLRLSLVSERAFDANQDSFRSGLVQQLPLGFSVAASGSTAHDKGGGDDTSMSLTITKRILGGGTWEDSLKGIDDAEIDALATLNELIRAKRQIRLEVRRSFYQLVRASQALGVQETRLAAARKNLEGARIRENPVDIATAQLEVPEREQAVLAAKRAILKAEDNLKLLIGKSPGEALAFDTRFEFRFDTVSPAQDLLVAQGRDELFLNNGLKQKKLERSSRVAGRAVLPSVDLYYRHTYADNGNHSVNLDGQGDDSAGVALTWDIGSRANRARLAIAESDLEDARTDERVLVLEKGAELRELARRLEDARDGIRLQEERIKLAQFQVDLYRQRWEDGKADILEYIRAQNNLEQAKVDLISLRTSYMENLEQYNFASARDQVAAPVPAPVATP